MPFLIAVNGQRALAHAAEQADTLGLFGLGRTLADGHRHEARWQADRLDRTIAFIREHQGERELEFNALVQRVAITDNRQLAAEEFVAQVEGLSVEDALSTPYLALGTHTQIAEHLQRCRDRWGITYYTVRDLDGFAPVIELLSAAE
jgi:hypothetical protein